MNIDPKKLFKELLKSPVENTVFEVLNSYGLNTSQQNWKPYGGHEGNYAVVENQQASPVPALIEKITNGIDAILMRACIEAKIDPRSAQAPRSIEKALNQFFPDHKNWDLHKNQRAMAERLQIIADGPIKETSLVIYDDGEGQEPEDFEKTFLSLLKGNKNDIHFVQGKYNMGGSGALIFCGKHRYQLIASRRFNGKGKLGFTLVRKHPLSTEESKQKKSTWYEYLVLDDEIPSFDFEEEDLGLYNRNFKSGTIIKLFSYELPPGSRSVISRDLNLSINEYLFTPALPVYTIDNEERYPKDRALQRYLYGLKRRLEADRAKYVDIVHSVSKNDSKFGQLKATFYVFKPKLDGASAKETRATIRREFFKNNMSVLFSLNGQVHGHYTSEFITRSLSLPILKDHLLIHLDCTEIKTEERSELFMASRDRLKGGDTSSRLRQVLAEMLISDGRLKEIHKKRKASITVDSADSEEMLRNIGKKLMFDKEITDLLSPIFNLDDRQGGKRNKKNDKSRNKNPKKEIIKTQRYPSYMEINTKVKTKERIPLVKIPLGSKRNMLFSTDVEDDYFDRVEDPGDMQIRLKQYLRAGDPRGVPSPDPVPQIESLLDVENSSPSNGSIRISMKPTKDVQVGDTITIMASLSSPEKQLEQVFIVEILDPEKKDRNKRSETPEPKLALPKPVKVYNENSRGDFVWDKLEETGIQMNHGIVVYPLVEDDKLSAVYINMDSRAMLSYKKKFSNESEIKAAENRYLSKVYFHTLFIFMITKNKNFVISKENETGVKDSIEISAYISDLFSPLYTQFLLDFEKSELSSLLEEE